MMFLVRFKCPNCGATFKALRMLVSSETTKKCSKCGTASIGPVEEDLRVIKLEERESCSFG